MDFDLDSPLGGSPSRRVVLTLIDVDKLNRHRRIQAGGLKVSKDKLSPLAGDVVTG